MNKPQCGGSCIGCYYCPDLHPVEMQPVSAALPETETIGQWIDLGYQRGIREGRFQILAEQAANRQILAKHWEK